MRPQLFAGGLMVTLMGGGFYFLEIPFVYFWSIPFAIGGGIMVLASFFMSESPGPVAPPEGYRFCVFCATPVPLDAQRCPQCNGVQPTGGR
jgi:hypothetical protein